LVLSVWGAGRRLGPKLCSYVVMVVGRRCGGLHTRWAMWALLFGRVAHISICFGGPSNIRVCAPAHKEDATSTSPRAATRHHEGAIRHLTAGVHVCLMLFIS
jgi:hypothetical protein